MFEPQLAHLQKIDKSRTMGAISSEEEKNKTADALCDLLKMVIKDLPELLHIQIIGGGTSRKAIEAAFNDQGQLVLYAR